MPLDRVIKDFCAGVLFRSRPDGETESATQFQNAARFSACFFRMREVKQTKVYQHTIKSRVFKWQIPCIALDKWNVGERFFCDSEHVLGEIDSSRNSAHVLDCAGYVSGAACNIQDGHAGRDLSTGNQERNELAGERRPHGIVFVRYSLPAF